jgi:hypothetical protein
MLLSVEQINRILFALLGNNDVVNLWWQSPNRAFDMKTPRDLWSTNPQKVSTYVADQLEHSH